jgi:hypothetical protein
MKFYAILLLLGLLSVQGETIIEDVEEASATKPQAPSKPERKTLTDEETKRLKKQKKAKKQ